MNVKRLPEALIDNEVGPVRSIVIVADTTALAGPAFPAKSATEFDVSVITTVPSVQLVKVSV